MVIVETMTKGHFSAYFQDDEVSHVLERVYYVCIKHIKHRVMFATHKMKHMMIDSYENTSSACDLSCTNYGKNCGFQHYSYTTFSQHKMVPPSPAKHSGSSTFSHVRRFLIV